MNFSNGRIAMVNEWGSKEGKFFNEELKERDEEFGGEATIIFLTNTIYIIFFSLSGHQRIELMMPSVDGTLSSLVKARLLCYFLFSSILFLLLIPIPPLHR